MSKCKTRLNDHLEENGHKYYIAIVSVEVVYFILYNSIVFFEQEKSVNACQYYKFSTELLLMVSMIYFLYEAIVRHMAMDMLSFLIISTICNTFMIFRDILFLVDPAAFLATPPGEDLS